ncbi:jg27327, partial [Pararge aegeria aegeria]
TGRVTPRTNVIKLDVDNKTITSAFEVATAFETFFTNIPVSTTKSLKSSPDNALSLLKFNVPECNDTFKFSHEKTSVEIEAEIIVPSHEQKLSKTTTDENKENENAHDEYEKQNHKEDTQGNKHSGFNILSDTVVHRILDAAAGKLKLTPSIKVDVSLADR